MYRLIIAIYILLALPALLNASVTVRGKVLDRSSQELIVGANVMVMGTGEGGATDTEGYFEFSTTDPYPFTLAITHIGFYRQEVSVSVDTLLIIMMEPAFIIGEDVVVIGDRSQVGADVSSVIVVVTARNIESFGARDVGDALRPLPSVVINASTTGKQTVSIRGSNPNEVTVLLDGLRLNDSNTGLADLSAIDLNDLERVEIVKGGSTTLFGQGSFGGVVSLTSRLPDSNQVAFLRSYGLTDADDQDLSFSATGRLGILAAGGRYSGKSRRYDGNALYTNLFSSMSAAAYPYFGELVTKQYRLNNYLELPVGGVAQSDHMTLSTLNYRGSVLNSSNWTFFLGYRDWGWTDHFFTNLERQLEEGNVTGRISKQIINKKMSSILQLSYEEQNFIGNNLLYDSVLETYAHDSARLERINLGYTAVIRIIDEDINPLASQVRLEIALRGDQFITNHLQDAWTTDFSGVADTIIHSVDNSLRHGSLIRRMGIYMEGNTPSVNYAFFMNHGRNQRQPTLNDLFLWANSADEELRESPLKEEFLSTTDFGLNLIYPHGKSPSFPFELRITTSFFINLYTNKITYRFYEDRQPSPLNTDIARTSGYDLVLEGNLWDRRIRGQWAYQHITLNDPLVFPNNPEFRMTYLVEYRLPWLVVGYDFYRDGPQFILYNGSVSAESIERRENANLNIMLRWEVWHIQMSLAYSVRNLFSDLPVRAGPMQDYASSPFQYYESHRRIITFRVGL